MNLTTSGVTRPNQTPEGYALVRLGIIGGEGRGRVLANLAAFPSAYGKAIALESGQEYSRDGKGQIGSLALAEIVPVARLCEFSISRSVLNGVSFREIFAKFGLCR